MSELHKHLWTIATILPTDYTDFGGEVARWSDPSKSYPDCSCGCRWFLPLEDEPLDWGVCGKPGAPRRGLLTFEHQTGEGCYEHCEEGESLSEKSREEWQRRHEQIRREVAERKEQSQ